MSNASTTSFTYRSLMRRTSSTNSEFGGDTQKRHLVVGLAETRRQRAHEVPEQLVREVAVDEQEVLEIFFADDEQPALLVDDGVRRAREVVDERHLAEVRAVLEHGQRLFAHARHDARDAHRAVDDEVELVALVTLGE